MTPPERRSPPTPAELDEILEHGLRSNPWQWRRPLRARYIYLPARVIKIGERAWHASAENNGAWGYTPRQARKMRKALLPILKIYRQQLEDFLISLTAEGD